MQPMYRGRFAPTPSGPLHFGSLVAALGSYLDARKSSGRWQVRIDDLDPPRVAKGVADAILRCLARFGFEWDGEVIWQSRHAEAYHHALHLLSRRSLIYPCACSRKELSDAAALGIDGPIYPGTCRRHGLKERPARALRVIVPEEEIRFDDRVQGCITQNLSRSIGDFALYRADRVVAYHLACVVDDAEQGITDVVRGADLIDATPRQIYLQTVLGVVTPRYLHLPLALNAAGEKLSKQTRAADIASLPVISALAEALRFLGQSQVTVGDFSSPREFLDHAINEWSPAKIPRRQLPVEIARISG
jgi:glutamyl-Q tRNA(Asp) synthetase